jgi:hypothetical protein
MCACCISCLLIMYAWLHLDDDVITVRYLWQSALTGANEVQVLLAADS